MRKFLVMACSLIVLFCMVSAFDNDKTLEGYTVVFENSGGTSIAWVRNGALYSPKINRHNSTGYASLQLKIEGTGTADVAYLVSNDGVTFVAENGASLLFDGVTATSGPDGNGNMACNIPMGSFSWMKLKISEISDTSSITPTAKLAWQ